MNREDTYVVEDDFLFVGRTFGEYCDMFDLSPSELRGSVLDCPGGPSSFTAAASALGADALAVDPAYGRPLSDLEDACTEAVEETVAQLAEKRDLFVWDYYGDVRTRGRYLRAASERFLADYASHAARYLPAALLDLPLASNAVDLALSANLCFLYDDRLDQAFHVAALRELARVAREVRVFPLHSLDGERSELLAPVLEALRADGLSAELRPVPYEFQPGATEMLVVSAA